MDKQLISTLKGSFLVAMPSMLDPHFNHSVILMCEHTAGGSMGFVVNHQNLQIQSGSVFNDLHLSYKPELAAKPLYVGGPMGRGELFILHDNPASWKDSLTISRDIGLNLSRSMIEKIANGAGPSAYSLLVGYAEWAPGQLDEELKRNDWLVTPAKKEIIFDCPVQDIWKATLGSMGIKPVQLSMFGGSA